MPPAALSSQGDKPKTDKPKTGQATASQDWHHSCIFQESVTLCIIHDELQHRTLNSRRLNGSEEMRWLSRPAWGHTEVTFFLIVLVLLVIKQDSTGHVAEVNPKKFIRLWPHTSHCTELAQREHGLKHSGHQPVPALPDWRGPMMRSVRPAVS